MRKAREYVEFTEEMKKDYTILAPNMLPLHFKLIARVLRGRGYKMEILDTSGPKVVEAGLKYVHNDSCYPAVLVIGQFINALNSGLYDPHKVALILFQTGGGCRASNYIFLLRKALKRAGYGYVPVISFNFNGLEKHSGFRLTIPLIQKMFYGVVCADVIMSLKNQCKPYELNPGESEALADELTDGIADRINGSSGTFLSLEKTCRELVERFAAIPRRTTKKVQVGVVGEIYVKYSPLGNNNLEQFLVDEGAEVIVPGLLDFCLYCVYNSIVDHKLYGRNMLKYLGAKILYRFLTSQVDKIIKVFNEEGSFTPPTPFYRTVTLVEGYISVGTKMGEGWLLTAEMLELADRGVDNIVCTQPFGCLPNHICGKGMMKPIKDNNPNMNIVAIDYDPGASVVNQENRLKLMLANASELAAV